MVISLASLICQLICKGRKKKGCPWSKIRKHKNEYLLKKQTQRRRSSALISSLISLHVKCSLETNETVIFGEKKLEFFSLTFSPPNIFLSVAPKINEILENWMIVQIFSFVCFKD